MFSSETSKNTERQSIRDGKDIHKCKHVIPFEFDAFFSKTTHQERIPRVKNGKMQSERETNENQSRRQKGIDGIKLIADGFFAEKERAQKKHKMQCQEWKAKSNQIANEREKSGGKN